MYYSIDWAGHVAYIIYNLRSNSEQNVIIVADFMHVKNLKIQGNWSP